MSDQIIIYEQPLNELVRVSLRIEHLFKQLEASEQIENLSFRHQVMIKLLIDLLNIFDRPDIKSKITKEFIRFLAYFVRLEDHEEISRELLEEIREKLNDLLKNYLNTPGKVGQRLRQNEFLLSMKQNLMSAGGDSSCDAPAFNYWLRQSEKQRAIDLANWVADFDEPKKAIKLLLSIVRHSAEPTEQIAEKGFYHLGLNPQQPIQLIRVAIPKNEILYPEISAGRHRMSVRFVKPNMETRPKQTDANVTFELTLCRI